MANYTAYSGLNDLLNAQYDNARLAQQQMFGAGLSGTGISSVGWDHGTAATTVTNVAYDQYLRLANQAPQQQKQKPKQCSRAGELLHDLRREIDDWHGDVLRAA